MCGGRPAVAPRMAAAPAPMSSMHAVLPPAPQKTVHALSDEQYQIPSDQVLPPQAYRRVPATPLALAGFLAAPDLLAG